MSPAPLRLVVFGLSLSSSWGNGHATTYRALLKAFAARGHDVLFLERDQPWYAANRDLQRPDFCRLALYSDLGELTDYRAEIATADAIMVGSYVPEGAEVGAWVQQVARGTTAFYDIDTPVTLARLEEGSCAYLTPDLIRGYDLYLSFTGGPTLQRLVQQYGAPAARALYCSVDTTFYRPSFASAEYALGYLGTYSPDRQPGLERLLIEVARRAPELRFVVAGAQYPADLTWPINVTRIEHVPPSRHPAFYGSCRFALNVTRAEMVSAGYSPSVRLFEAAACGVPIISDRWPGLESILLPEREIVVADTPEDVLAVLMTWPESRRRALAAAARRCVLDQHSAAHRALELERALIEAMHSDPRTAPRASGSEVRAVSY